MDKQKDKPLYVAFSTQKGGAGKTTLTVLMASYLHYIKGYDVAVIDCDFPQYSIPLSRYSHSNATNQDWIEEYLSDTTEKTEKVEVRALAEL